MPRILGVDPGLRVTGFGVVDVDGPRLRYVASGVVRSGTGDLAVRLKTLYDGLAEAIRLYQPDAAAVEIVFVNVNPQSTLLLGQARGAVLMSLALHALPVHEYTALQIKRAVAGHGRAAKAQMQAMVQRLLALPGVPSTDAADALGCAICHAHAAPMAARAALAAMDAARNSTSAPQRTRGARNLRDVDATLDSASDAAPSAATILRVVRSSRRASFRGGRLR